MMILPCLVAAHLAAPVQCLSGQKPSSFETYHDYIGPDFSAVPKFGLTGFGPVMGQGSSQKPLKGSCLQELLSFLMQACPTCAQLHSSSHRSDKEKLLLIS